MEITPVVPLTGYAEEYWDYIYPILDRLGVLMETDTTMLTILCQDWELYRRAYEQLVAEEGIVATEETTKGSRRNPLYAICSSYRDSINRILAQFGMSPSARNSVAMKPKEELNPFKAL